MNSSDRVVYLKAANAKNKSVNAPHARGERILSINDVPQSVSKNQSLADLRSTKQQSLMNSSNKKSRRASQHPDKNQEVFYRLESDNKETSDKVIVRVKQTPRRNRNLQSGNTSVAVT